MQYKKEEIKKRILEVAFAEFEKEGYYKANVLRIATRAKVPIGNLYRYFSNKSALFEALVGEAAEAIPHFVKSMYEQNAQGIDSDEKSEEISAGMLNIFRRYGREFILLLDRSQGSKYAEFAESLRKEICGIWKTAFGRGGEDDFMIETLAEGFISGSLKILRSAGEAERGKLLERLLKFYFSNIRERL
ncbi:MAG TPA: helix-turn-helix domain-containing protein [Clostridia bacterium]|jgi:AcrR family transcriptional regulator|nr:helix-turn-helix domain-containing protein [Clostridia bacterium]HOK82038.1 helix-turn-helix domain-containing protein [Clostridia bacterium]HOL61268.1 helix-turn-helix domain-containing protein [Clostridia bacterium]HPO53667.1 helix-turn-helix domain-containing protein [Clostridia bacterium]